MDFRLRLLQGNNSVNYAENKKLKRILTDKGKVVRPIDLYDLPIPVAIHTEILIKGCKINGRRDTRTWVRKLL